MATQVIGPRRSPWKVAVGLIVALAVVAGLWWATTNPEAFLGKGGVAASTQGMPRVGQEAPDFTAPGVDGKPVRLSSLQGKPVWLSFGASWCQGCRSEAADVQAVYTAQGRDVHFLFGYLEDAGAAKQFMTTLGITYPGFVDEDRGVSSLYQANALPVHFFLDAKGIVSDVHIGPVSKAQAEGYLAKAAKGS